MSLVNDLLIELDRNREGGSRSDANPLDGLSPQRTFPPAEKQRVGPVPIVLALIAAGGLGFSVARLDSPENPETELASTRSHAKITKSSTLAANAPPLPRVSAPRPPERLADTRLRDFQVERPVALRAIHVAETGDATRVEIALDRAADFRIETGENDRQFDLVLEGATLRTALPTLDLSGTAIRSVRTRREGQAIRLGFALDSAARVQSQRLDQDDGTTLIINFQPTTQTRIKAAPAKEAQSRKRAKQPKNTASPERPGRTNLSAIRKKKPNHNMKISRSAGDQKRNHHANAQQSAQRTVELARDAKESGDLEGAALLYSAARKESPGHPEALVEGVMVLSELGRIDEALSLVVEARSTAPTNQVYLMMHAKLLALENLQAAIGILEDSGLSVEDGPKVHALAAAYLQKTGQHDAAIERYESILRRYPNRPEIWMGLGISLEARGRNAEAIDVYRIAMQTGELPGQSRGWVSARIDALGQES